ncbi:MAG: hypothetical protein QXX17_02445 [Conexivisphaerales archaeon]
MQIQAWSYQMLVGAFLVFIGEASMIQGIISLITASIPVAELPSLNYTLMGLGAAGLLFTLSGIVLQAAGILIILGIGKKTKNLNSNSKISLTA